MENLECAEKNIISFSHIILSSSTLTLFTFILLLFWCFTVLFFVFRMRYQLHTATQRWIMPVKLAPLVHFFFFFSRCAPIVFLHSSLVTLLGLYITPPYTIPKKYEVYNRPNYYIYINRVANCSIFYPYRKVFLSFLFAISSEMCLLQSLAFDLQRISSQGAFSDGFWDGQQKIYTFKRIILIRENIMPPTFFSCSSSKKNENQKNQG